MVKDVKKCMDNIIKVQMKDLKFALKQDLKHILDELLVPVPGPINRLKLVKSSLVDIRSRA